MHRKERSCRRFISREEPIEDSESQGSLINTGLGGFCHRYTENDRTLKTTKQISIVLSFLYYKNVMIGQNGEQKTY